MSILLTVYADGACRGNPGLGGWGAIIHSQQAQRVWEIGGHDVHTTNNRMELKAAIGALESIAVEPGAIKFHTDSSYVINGITKWVFGWEKNDWQTSTGSAVVNRDLWEQLIRLVRKRERLGAVHWQHVLGHAGIPGNERADEIAQAFADGKSIRLYDGKFADYQIDLVYVPGQAGPKKPSKSRSKKEAYLYLSVVNGTLMRHKTWDECNARVKGVPRAKFKKVLSPEEETLVLKEWGLN